MPYGTPKTATFLLTPSETFAQSCSSTTIGDNTFYNFGGVSGSKQFIGQTDFYNFSDGSSTTRSNVGRTDLCSGSRLSLSGSTNSIGGTTFSTRQDGTTSTHQSIGGTSFLSQFQQRSELHEQSSGVEYLHEVQLIGFGIMYVQAGKQSLITRWLHIPP